MQKKNPADKLVGIEARDRGCKFFPLCANCPYPDCLINTATGKLWLEKKRNKRLVAQIMTEQGYNQMKIAVALGFSSTLKWIFTGRVTS